MGMIINPYVFGSVLGPGTTYSGVYPNTTSPYGGYTVIDRTLVLTNGKTVWSLGVLWSAASAGKLKIVKRNSAGNYDVVVDQAISHPGGNTWLDAVLSSPFSIPGTGDYFMASYHASGSQPFNNGSYPRAYKTGDQGVSAGITFTEDSLGAFPFRWTEAV
jgi:hypothetical protein